MNFPNKKYRVIYADPPWSYGDTMFGSRPGGALSTSYNPKCGRYSTMSNSDIILMGRHVRRITSVNAACFMWATSPLLPEALKTMAVWGFDYRTVAFVWSKTTVSGKEVTNLGQWTLGNVEICLLGIRGSLTRLAKNVRQLCTAERTSHSSKPNEIRDRIVTLFGDVPRIELFARNTTPGWDVWGNEV